MHARTYVICAEVLAAKRPETAAKRPETAAKRPETATKRPETAAKLTAKRPLTVWPMCGAVHVLQPAGLCEQGRRAQW